MVHFLKIPHIYQDGAFRTPTIYVSSWVLDQFDFDIGRYCICQLAMNLDDSPWEDNTTSLRETEWSKISSDFLNVCVMNDV